MSTERGGAARSGGATAYEGEVFALLTQHGKEATVGPLLADAFGARVVRVQGFDTDLLGTFTRDIPRVGTRLEAARRKAQLGQELSGLPLGLGSEGSFVPGPLGLLSWNLELIVLRDATRGIEVVGRAFAPGQHAHARVTDREGLEEAARRAGFPAHGLVVRPMTEDDPRVEKGLCTWDALHQAFARALAQSRTGIVIVENDLRAHLNPTRQATIAAATADLVARLRCPCAACGSPGFGLAVRLPGLACGGCGAPTREIGTERYACVACSHREDRAVARGHADPLRCERCNP